MIEVDEIFKAIDRIARTADGELLFRYLQREALSLPDAGGNKGALRQHDGRRRFALDLMARMAKGIDERGGRSSNDTSGIAERPAVFAPRRAVSIAGRESFRDHARRTDPECQPLTTDPKPAA